MSERSQIYIQCTLSRASMYTTSLYWPGLLLVMHFVLLLVFAFNPQQDPSIIASNTSGSRDLSLCQWWSLHKLVSRHTERFICSELNHFSCLNHDPSSQLLRRRLAYSWVATHGWVYISDSVSIALTTFIGVLVFLLANVTKKVQSSSNQKSRWKKWVLKVMTTCLIS